ncbi:hypothetical protein [Nostoc sp. DedQUE09]|uniref:hypothetical protein n=1 Tax=Nostoc sp. DedQUE09 TaxID=3075394 RepID=UPI002AD4F2BC|nr:hypothetical protein [Nostoc sp. DedQUE09]MDZ7952802.1 hypothetical protein [Nostoc sp. DedQUE09]
MDKQIYCDVLRFFALYQSMVLAYFLIVPVLASDAIASDEVMSILHLLNFGAIASPPSKKLAMASDEVFDTKTKLSNLCSFCFSMK